MELISRQTEIRLLNTLLNSSNPEFVAVYGRRRVGKTFLIRQTLAHRFAFQMTGIANVSVRQQLSNFWSAFMQYSPTGTNSPPTDWFVAFAWLRDLLTQQPDNEPLVVFLDELPWLDTPRSGFVAALEHFWNSYGATNPRLKLIVCGSAASWMIQKLINNRGGLHNRITKRIHLLPFSLAEVETYFRAGGILLDRYQIIQLYAVMGGIPFYLSQVERGLSAAQVIDNLCFSDSGLLRTEYQNLYRSLFQQAGAHTAIVEALGTKARGLTRTELVEQTKMQDGGSLTQVLDELELSGFITKYTPFGRKFRNSLYQLTDPYSLFYQRFIKDSKATGSGAWLNLTGSGAWQAWSGYAFEIVCLQHSQQLKKALGISGVYTELSSWRSQISTPGAQIDLLIDRKDNVITVCEMKFSTGVFTITKAYAEVLRNKIDALRTESKTRKTIFLAMVTTYGIQENEQTLGLVQNSLTMDDLFD
jgi:uncharacterized protein